jgi:glycerophosphoryl diester phosphodiesterase
VSGDAVSAELVIAAHKRGEMVFAWDNGSGDDLKRALRSGIDIIMTGRPDIVISEIRRLQA